MILPDSGSVGLLFCEKTEDAIILLPCGFANAIAVKNFQYLVIHYVLEEAKAAAACNVNLLPIGSRQKSTARQGRRNTAVKNGFTVYGVECAKDVTTHIITVICTTAGEELKFARTGMIIEFFEPGRYLTDTILTHQEGNARLTELMSMATTAPITVGGLI